MESRRYIAKHFLYMIQLLALFANGELLLMPQVLNFQLLLIHHFLLELVLQSGILLFVILQLPPRQRVIYLYSTHYVASLTFVIFQTRP